MRNTLSVPLSRRDFGSLAVGTGLAVTSFPGAMAAGFTGDGLERVRPEDQGVDPAAFSALLDALANEKQEMNSLMFARGGKVIFEGWWWPYLPARKHMMHSLAKSTLACAVGIALADKRFALSDKVVSFFPEHLPAQVSDNLKAMTIEHLLTMRCGHAEETSGSVWRPIKTSWIAEFFKIPVELPPGSKFVYTSAASYMLSAIVTKTTGQTVRDYLETRTFQPLGIIDAEWDSSPDNVSPGGNGLTWRTSDIVKMCMLHAQRGVWNGKQILPADWIAAASKRQGGNDRYGYQWWVSPKNNYYALGKFCQIGLVFPEHNAVMALTSANESGNKLIKIVENIFPEAFKTAPLSRNNAGWSALKTRADGLRLLPALTQTTSALEQKLSGQIFDVAPNEDGVKSLGFRFTDGGCVFTQQDPRGTHSITAGLRDWVEGITTMTGAKLHHEYEPARMPVVAGATWTGPDTLEMTWQFVESSFRDHVVCRFDGPTITFDRSVNINSSALSRPALKGRVRS